MLSAGTSFTKESLGKKQKLEDTQKTMDVDTKTFGYLLRQNKKKKLASAGK